MNSSEDQYLRMKKNLIPWIFYLTSSFTHPTSGDCWRKGVLKKISLVSLAYIFALMSLPDSTLCTGSSKHSPISSRFSEWVGVQGKLWTTQCCRSEDHYIIRIFTSQQRISYLHLTPHNFTLLQIWKVFNLSAIDSHYKQEFEPQTSYFSGSWIDRFSVVTVLKFRKIWKFVIVDFYCNVFFLTNGRNP